MRTTKQLFYLVFFFIHLIFFNLNIYAEKKVAPPEELKLKQDINSIETSGLVGELITFSQINGKHIEQRQYYFINQKKQLIYLIKKVGNKDVDLATFIGRKVKAKGKIIHKSELTKYVDKKGNSFIFTELETIEVIENKK